MAKQDIVKEMESLTRLIINTPKNKEELQFAKDMLEQSRGNANMFPLYVQVVLQGNRYQTLKNQLEEG